MAYNLAGDRVVLFGGMRAGTTADGETWLWDGTTWSMASPPVAPVPRFGHAMTYDAAHARIVLFGGASSFGNDLDDTWTWDGTSWQLHAPAHRPSPRAGSAMVFDQSLDRVVLFGGSGAGVFHGDTWWWDGSDWLPIFTATAPSPRYAHAMAHDSARGRVVLFGGRSANQAFLDDLYEWNGAQWFAVLPATRPQARFHHVMTFDAGIRRCILSGGNDGQPRSDTWSWDGGIWTQIPSVAPTPRYQSGAAFDLRRNRTVLFGGGDGAALLDDTWEFDGGTPAPVATTSVFGVGCGSPPLTIAPTPGSRPLLGGQQITGIGNLVGAPCFLAFGSSSSHAGAIALPLMLSHFGMVNCRLYHDLAFASEPCLMSGATTALHVLAIPLLPSLIGLRIHQQAWAAAPGVNPAGIVTSNAVELVLGNV